MATSSQVKSALDAIAEAIALNRSRLVAAKGTAGEVSSTLGGLPTQYADVISTINAYTTTDAFENLSKAELAKLSSEFTGLTSAANAIVATTF
jgi:hypothetical protein